MDLIRYNPSIGRLLVMLGNVRTPHSPTPLIMSESGMGDNNHAPPPLRTHLLLGNARERAQKKSCVKIVVFICERSKGVYG